MCHLCKGQASLIVHLEDLLDGIDVSCRPQIQAQVVLVCRAHNLLQRKILLHEYRFASININNICAMGEVAFFAQWSYHTILKWAWSEGWTFWKKYLNHFMVTQSCYKAAEGGVKGGSCSTCCRFTGSIIEWCYGRQLQHVLWPSKLFNDIKIAYPGRPLHSVGKTRVHNVLLRGSLCQTQTHHINLTWGLRIAGPKQGT